MPERSFRYVIVGGGLAGASAAAGIRELDAEGSILMLGREHHYPYHRPPLSKKLWTGEKRVEEIFVREESWWPAHGVEVVRGTGAAALDAEAGTVTDGAGSVWRYEKLLLACGGRPRVLGIPGGDLPGVRYFRTLDDYLALRAEAVAGRTALVVGGGFLGSELAAVLASAGLRVVMVFPSDRLCARVFPESLARAVEELFAERGVRMLSGDHPLSIEKAGDGFMTLTAEGGTVKSDLVVVGVGILPESELAAGAGLEVEDAIRVDEQLRTSRPGVWAAGDCAVTPCAALGRSWRSEHWDNARATGRQAGRNMAGAGEPFGYLPYFFSDLFDFGYEAVGEIDSRLEILADWSRPNKTGVLYYLREGRVRGVMLCGVRDRLDAARRLIVGGRRFSRADLKGAIG